MILFNDFKSEPKKLRDEMLIATKRVIDSGWFILGNEVKSFEKEWADACEVKYCAGVGNGLDALEIGMRALSIGKGDEVITTPMTAFATVLSIILTGAKPVFADIDPNNAMLDPDSVIRCISDKTKAVILVHLYGQSGPLNKLSEIAKNYKIHLIEDCAQAHGAKFNGKKIGGFGSLGTWSFYPTKNLGAIGDAGAITTNSKTLFEKVRSIRNYGQTVRYHHPNMGLNSRLDELQAALLSVRLKRLNSWIDRRKKISNIYFSEIKNPNVNLLSLPRDDSSHVYHLFVVTSKYREKLKNYLFSHKIETLIHYPIPAHMQEACNDMRLNPDGLKNVQSHADACLSLPCHPYLNDGEVNYIVDKINSFRP